MLQEYTIVWIECVYLLSGSYVLCIGVVIVCKGIQLANDTEGVLSTNSEGAVRVTSLRSGGGGFRGGSLEPRFSFILRAFSIQEVVLASRYV